MKYGMKTFDIIEQVPFNLSPQGPHKNLVRQITEEMGIEVKRKRVNNKDVYFIDDLPTAMNPEAIRAARVLIYDVSNHQYDGSINRGLEYHPSILNRPGGEPVSVVDATGDWIHVLTLPTLIWKLADSPREQFPCGRGICYLPSLEVFHAYRVETENTGAVQTLLNLPAYEPSKSRNLRAPRSPDAAGIHPEMLYCEFKEL